MKKKPFEKPEIKIIDLEDDIVLESSADCPADCTSDCTSDCSGDCYGDGCPYVTCHYY